MCNSFLFLPWWRCSYSDSGDVWIFGRLRGIHTTKHRPHLQRNVQNVRLSVGRIGFIPNYDWTSWDQCDIFSFAYFWNVAAGSRIWMGHHTSTSWCGLTWAWCSCLIQPCSLWLWRSSGPWGEPVLASAEGYPVVIISGNWTRRSARDFARILPQWWASVVC